MTPEQAKQKFATGKAMRGSELRLLPLLDRVRYVVNRFFPRGATAVEATRKLRDLRAIGPGVTVLDVADELERFWG